MTKEEEDEFMDFGCVDDPEYSKMLKIADEAETEEEREKIKDDWYKEQMKKDMLANANAAATEEERELLMSLMEKALKNR
jgi:hypothetical protein